MRTLRSAPWLFLVPVVFLAACGNESSSGWTRIDPNAMSETQKGQEAKGQAAKKALFSRLLGRLSEGLAEGPGPAIHACNVAAPEIAAAVGTEKGMRIGRTSHRLRNPKNVAPAWAESYVRRETAEPVWLAHRDGRLAGLLPISTMGMCLTCHGPWAGIPKPVRKALSELYPEDRATEFLPGDLRGWFWLEIPAP